MLLGTWTCIAASFELMMGRAMAKPLFNSILSLRAERWPKVELLTVTVVT